MIVCVYESDERDRDKRKRHMERQRMRGTCTETNIRERCREQRDTELACL